MSASCFPVSRLDLWTLVLSYRRKGIEQIGRGEWERIKEREGRRTIWWRDGPVPTKRLAGKEEEGELIRDPPHSDIAKEDLDCDLGSRAEGETPIEHEHAEFEEVERINHSLHRVSLKYRNSRDILSFALAALD